MHGFTCASARRVSLLSLLAVFGVAMLNPAQSRADTMRKPFDFEVAALPPHGMSPIERMGDPMIELERAPLRRKPRWLQLVSCGCEVPRDSR